MEFQLFWKEGKVNIVSWHLYIYIYVYVYIYITSEIQIFWLFKLIVLGTALVFVEYVITKTTKSNTDIVRNQSKKLKKHENKVFFSLSGIQKFQDYELGYYLTY